MRPIFAQRVADRDVGGRAEGKDRGGLAEKALHLAIRLMVSEVQGSLRDPCRPFLDLDAEKVIQLDHDLSMFSPVVEEHRGLELVVILAGEFQLPDTHQDFGVQAAQFAVGDDQEVAAAAGGIHDPQLAELFTKVRQLFCVVHVVCEFLAQLVEEERTKRLEDVCLAGVVFAELAACLGGLDSLEERPEDCGADARPVEGARAHELVTHRGGEAGDVELLLEDPAVDVRETRGQLVQGRLTALHGCFQRLVEDCELCAEVAAVFTSSGLEKLREQVAFPQARVVTVETKKGANEEDRGLVIAVTRPVQGLVEVGHDAGGPNRGLLLFARTDLDHAVASEELQVVDMIGELGESKLCAPGISRTVSCQLTVEIDDPDASEVADDEEARSLNVGEIVDVIKSLLLGLVEILPRGLHLDERLARDEGVDIALTSRRRSVRTPLVGDSFAFGDTEALHEFTHELMALLFLITHAIAPLVSKFHASFANGVERERGGHGRLLVVDGSGRENYSASVRYISISTLDSLLVRVAARDRRFHVLHSEAMKNTKFVLIDRSHRH